jgi:hypothetical protein
MGSQNCPRNAAEAPLAAGNTTFLEQKAEKRASSVCGPKTDFSTKFLRFWFVFGEEVTRIFCFWHVKFVNFPLLSQSMKPASLAFFWFWKLHGIQLSSSHDYLWLRDALSSCGAERVPRAFGALRATRASRADHNLISEVNELCALLEVDAPIVISNWETATRPMVGAPDEESELYVCGGCWRPPDCELTQRASQGDIAPS